MKKNIIVLLCTALLLSLSVLTLYNGTKILSRATRANESVPNKSNSEDNELSKERQLPFDDNVSLVTVDDLKKEKTESKGEKTQTYFPQNPPKTQSIKANGKTYTADFKEVTKSNDRDKRDLNEYYKDDRSVDLKFDSITDELLFAQFRTTTETEHKITEEHARKIAENFIKKHCNDFLSYTFDRVYESSSGYDIDYSKHIDGYESIQRILVIVRFDGNIALYSNHKYVFDGIDTNVKINADKLAKELDEMIKKDFDKPVTYTVKSQSVDIDNDGNLAMCYSVDVVEAESTQFSVFYVPIK